ncbi:hypothetical protein [Nocardia brasiliensis]|uniref:hypothetical protein n=1 Tax=Nocardia brasiliensis TaxID=37326 RepID=UPI0024561300|nr:hypothetical protein [Nocardia brasiliensis]
MLDLTRAMHFAAQNLARVDEGAGASTRSVFGSIGAAVDPLLGPTAISPAAMLHRLLRVPAESAHNNELRAWLNELASGVSGGAGRFGLEMRDATYSVLPSGADYAPVVHGFDARMMVVDSDGGEMGPFAFKVFTHPENTLSAAEEFDGVTPASSGANDRASVLLTEWRGAVPKAFTPEEFGVIEEFFRSNSIDRIYASAEHGPAGALADDPTGMVEGGNASMFLATAGYRWEGNMLHERTIFELEERAGVIERDLLVPIEHRQTLHTAITRFYEPFENFPSPRELAEVPEVGERLMRGTQWLAVKEL